MSRKLFALAGIFILIVAVFVIYLMTREGEAQLSDESAYAEYVNAYTSGFISRESSIKVRLAQEYRTGEEKIIPASLNLIKLDPSVDGETYWLDNQTIEFTPKEKLESDTKFTVTFDLD